MLDIFYLIDPLPVVIHPSPEIVDLPDMTNLFYTHTHLIDLTPDSHSPTCQICPTSSIHTHLIDLTPVRDCPTYLICPTCFIYTHTPNRPNPSQSFSHLPDMSNLFYIHTHLIDLTPVSHSPTYLICPTCSIHTPI